MIEFARQMRHEPTPAEEVLWRLLRNYRLANLKSRRQHPIGRYIADFYIASASLVIELDGDTHTTEEGIEHDRVRHCYLESLGLMIIRFWNFEVKETQTVYLTGLQNCVCNGKDFGGTGPHGLMPHSSKRNPQVTESSCLQIKPTAPTSPPF
ncbi:MAG: endonuclease domain-containing protein [Planctomycetes bacterium]|nr:endonuclease domain-containing protein [Planctomycetota bacterium]